jgi:predicted metal-dependent hydrolase
MHLERDVALIRGQPLEFETIRSARRRRTIEVSVTAEGVVRVAAPLWTSRAEVVALVGRRADWIARQRERIAAAPVRRLQFVTGELLPHLGRDLRLEVTAEARARSTVARDESSLRLSLPAATLDHDRPEAARRAVIAWYRREAAAYLDARIDWWAAAVGRRPAAVRVRDQRTRWGSCAPDGTLRFNWRLAMFEPGVFDYVIVHELAHLLVRNHSPAFWAEVERVLPDHRERKAALRRAAASLPL